MKLLFCVEVEDLHEVTSLSFCCCLGAPTTTTSWASMVTASDSEGFTSFVSGLFIDYMFHYVSLLSHSETSLQFQQRCFTRQGLCFTMSSTTFHYYFTPPKVSPWEQWYCPADSSTSPGEKRNSKGLQHGCCVNSFGLPICNDFAAGWVANIRYLTTSMLGNDWINKLLPPISQWIVVSVLWSDACCHARRKQDSNNHKRKHRMPRIPEEAQMAISRTCSC